MSIWNGFRRLLSRAKEEATDVALVTKIRFDIRSLEGRRDQQFREIGRKVYEDRNIARFAGIDPLISKIDEIGVKIREKREELEGVRARERSTGPASAETPAG